MGHRRHDLELKARIWIATIQVQSAGDHSTSRVGGGNGGGQKSYRGKTVAHTGGRLLQNLVISTTTGVACCRAHGSNRSQSFDCYRLASREINPVSVPRRSPVYRRTRKLLPETIPGRDKPASDAPSSAQAVALRKTITLTRSTRAAPMRSPMRVVAGNIPAWRSRIASIA